MARNAGIRIICVKTGLQHRSVLKQENPDYLTKDFEQIIEIIRKINI